MRWPSLRLGLCVLASFVVLAMVQAWPLPRHLSTHLTGRPSDDTGVYVWNTWVFGHELRAGRSPFSTSSVFSLDPESDLSLHNYTAFADVLAIPLQPMVGVIAAFNLIYLLNVALAGFGMFLLARRITGRVAESWIAGLLFAWSPFIAARGAIHFSLVAAAPLPIFMYLLDRAWTSFRRRDAIGAGITAAWAGFCDPYYLVYCFMLGLLYVAWRLVAVVPRRDDRVTFRHLPTIIDVAGGALAVLIVAVHFIAGGSIHIASISFAMRTLYTPVLLLSLLALVRVLLILRPRLVLRPLPPLLPLLRLGAAATLAAAILLAPTLYAVGVRVATGQMVSAPVPWRSSAPGVDLAAFVLPNPNHPLAPTALVESLAAQPGGFVEQIASLSLVGLFVIAAASIWARFRPHPFWLTIAVGFGLLALGPFVHIFGVNTYLPTPWTLLRYVPIIGAARMPARFGIVAFMGFSVLVAMALAALVDRFPHRRRVLLLSVTFAVAFELLPAPRTLYSAEIPGVYKTIAADPRPIRVLELPFGIRDGLSSLGDFTAASQLHQTLHEKELIGGYLSRVSEQRKNFYLREPFYRALLTMSEGRSISDAQAAFARAGATVFLARSNVGYVVIDTSRATAALRSFAIEALHLTKIEQTDVYELYLPGKSEK